MSVRPFIIECKTAGEANTVDTRLYRFERFSETRDVYIFVLRANVKEE